MVDSGWWMEVKKGGTAALFVYHLLPITHHPSLITPYSGQRRERYTRATRLP
jgi:hypothetical protein